MPGCIEDRKEQSRRASSTLVRWLSRPLAAPTAAVSSARANYGGEDVTGALMIRPSTRLRVAVGMHRQEWP